MKTIDLHTHSTCSDGTLSPKELSEYASKKGLTAYALTDHDTTLGIEEAKFYAEKNNIELISGIEVSADYNKHEIHIIGLFIDYSNPALINKLKYIKENRTERNKKIITKLNDLNMKISYEEILAVNHIEENSNKIIARPHFARVLVKKGYASSIKECFDKYLDEGKPAYIKREVLSAKETISLINQAGGIAILAHPFYYKMSRLELNKMLEELSSQKNSLTGMECYYSTHTQQEVSYTLGLCSKYLLLPSGGSDFHGDNKPNLDLGTGYGSLKINYEILEKLKEGVSNVKGLR